MTSGKIEDLLEKANAGSRTDASVNLAKRQCLSAADAARCFTKVRANLLTIHEWSERSSMSDYALFDENGLDAGNTIEVGKLIRISLYGGGKYDWVRVMEITDDSLEFIITVKPSHDPTDSDSDPASVSHFFGPEAVNNFCVQLDGKVITVYVIGLNERQNIKFTDSLIESARNAAVANIGYYSGLQKGVWKEFCTRFLESCEGE